jgi:cellulose synthase operon protein B
MDSETMTDIVQKKSQLCGLLVLVWVLCSFSVLAVTTAQRYPPLGNPNISLIMNTETKSKNTRENKRLINQVYRWFTHMQLQNGLIESFENSNTVSLYDNALAALVFTVRGDRKRAERIFDFFERQLEKEFQMNNGGFSRLRNRDGEPNGNHWLGDNAWLLMALNTYASTVHSNRYQTMQNMLDAWIRKLQDTDGGIFQGYDTNGILSNKKVTENMIDAFNAVSGYDEFHQRILRYLKTNRWDTSAGLLLSWPDNQYAWALDNFAWGFCSLEEFPVRHLEHAELLLTFRRDTNTGRMIHGFSFDIDRDNIWYEGTGQMVVAYLKHGDQSRAEYFMNELKKTIISSAQFPKTKGIPYVSNMGTGYGNESLWDGADSVPCVASGAWFLFAAWQFDPFQVGFTKNIPADDRFWK